MHPKSHLLLELEINTINYYFEFSKNLFKKQLLDQYEDGHPLFNEYNYIVGSFRYFRQSVFYELNALVEHWLLQISSEEGKFLEAANLKRSRLSSVQIIEHKFGISIINIQGFNEVNDLKNLVNSLKHRGGSEFSDYSKGIPEIKFVKDDIKYLVQIKQRVFLFLKELMLIARLES